MTEGARPTGGAAPQGAPVELLVLTGMSGAGRSTAANVLEDHGWHVIDNLPPRLLPAPPARPYPG